MTGEAGTSGTQAFKDLAEIESIAQHEDPKDRYR